MKVITLKEKITQVLPSGLDATIFPFITDYNANASKYDLTFWRHYGLKDLLTDVNTSAEWNTLVSSVLYTYKEELQRYWDINIAEYSPVDNVFEETIQNHHTRAHEDKVVKGATKVDEHVGVGELLGGGSRTVTNYEVPMNSSTERELTRSTDEQTNIPLETLTESDQYEDVMQYGMQHERFKTNRHGNIGTTLSTDIMEGSRKFWTMFNFMNELYKLINNELFSGEWC